MSDKAKKIFFALTIIVPFLGYCVAYYLPIINNAPFKSKDFVSMQFNWGEGDSLVNQYNSKTGAYQYLNDGDSLIKKVVKLRKDDIIYLHNKANELGFWNFPDEIYNNKEDLKSSKIPRYYFEFKYKGKTKKVLFMSDYSKRPKLRDVALQMKTLVEKTISDAELRYGNQ